MTGVGSKIAGLQSRLKSVARKESCITSNTLRLLLLVVILVVEWVVGRSLQKYLELYISSICFCARHRVPHFRLMFSIGK